MCRYDWKDGEYQYCADLVKAGGDRNVPREHVDAYLVLQLCDARRSGNVDAITGMATLLAVWRDGDPFAD